MGLPKRGLDLDSLVGSTIVAFQFTYLIFKMAVIFDRIFKLRGAVYFHEVGFLCESSLV